MSFIEIQLRPIETNPDDWPEQMRKFHWRRSFECYAAELDEKAAWHRRQAQAIEAKMKAREHGR